MPLKNTKAQFGSLTKFLHWSIFLLFSLQFYLVNRRDYFPEGAQEKIDYIMLHKSVGVLLLFLGLFFIIWRHLGQRPAYPQGVAKWEMFLARATHLGLFIVMLAMPLSGMLMSFLSGYGVKFFGIPLPNFFSTNKDMAGFFHEMHEIIAFIIVFLVVLHIGAAVFHHRIRKDTVLKRMLPFVKMEDDNKTEQESS